MNQADASYYYITVNINGRSDEKMRITKYNFSSNIFCETFEITETVFQNFCIYI